MLKSPLLGISAEDYDSIARMSALTIDRRLRGRHPEQELKGIAHTRPAKALKNLVPVRTWGDWKDACPGEFQADTVGHDGGNPRGEFCFTLTLIDVASGWTELRALHTDNGGEFINLTVAAFCNRSSIALTSSRADRKNDNCYVECRNNDAVRRSVGYAL